MAHPTLHTVDAGQTYEAIEDSEINNSITELFNSLSKLTGSKDPTVSVMHCTKAKTNIGGRIDDMLCDRTFFFSPAKSVPVLQDYSG